MDAHQLAVALLGLLTIVVYVFGGLIVFLHLGIAVGQVESTRSTA